MNILKNFEKVKKTLSNNIKIVAVSKTKSKEKILEIYNTGHKDFGENRIQELKEKLLPSLSRKIFHYWKKGLQQ